MDQYGGPHSISFDDTLSQHGMALHDLIGKNNNNNFIDTIFSSMDTEPASPRVVITEQPKPKDHRFRYPCEGRTAGALLGVKSTQRKKTCPEVKIENLSSRALIIGSLVTKDEDVKPHPFKLVGANCSDGIVKKIVTPKCPKAKFESLGIQCVKKADLLEALKVRKNLQVDPYNNIDQCLLDDMQDLDCKVLRICFQAFLEDPNTGQFTQALSPVLTDNIYNKKDSNLKIMKMNKREGTAKGGDEVYIFCEKVDKEDIQVVFFEESKERDFWTDNGIFGSADVHHQIAIVLKTPPYKITEIKEEIEVKVRLQRISDQDVSDAEIFTYLPENADAEQIQAKRKRPAPSTDDYFTLADNGAGTSGSKLSDAKKKLQEKIRAKGRRQSSKSQITIKPETPFSFPSASGNPSFVSVRNDTIGRMTTVKTEMPSAVSIPETWWSPESNDVLADDANLNITAMEDVNAPFDAPNTTFTFTDIPVAVMPNENEDPNGSFGGLNIEALPTLFGNNSELNPAQFMEGNETTLPNFEDVFLTGLSTLPPQGTFFPGETGHGV